jgi:hypothetical protein
MLVLRHLGHFLGCSCCLRLPRSAYCKTTYYILACLKAPSCTSWHPRWAFSSSRVCGCPPTHVEVICLALFAVDVLLILRALVHHMCHLNRLMRILPAEWKIPTRCPSHWGTPSLILQIHKLGTPIIFVAMINQHSLVINKCYTPCCNHFLNGIASINRGRLLAFFLNVWTIRGMILQVLPSDHCIPCSISWYFVPNYWVTSHCLIEIFLLSRHVHRHFPLRPHWITCSKPM